ncbi:hypothetical protein K431DRAFT_280289 [Polychaeton citri CBS 116435]|uniref:Sulfate transporter n=1 Tax=Polychaeton citri CBS 116435 TaxID=1314669 RepID=A0A9P4QIN8_9PEZI|nr:hypothetical protein K431DRAFT_280289 [Polychaeton citri CBS 116435]
MAAIQSYLRKINTYNIQTLKQSPFAELSGSLGDLGTLLPLMIALTLTRSIDLSSTLVFTGLANIFTGLLFGIPLPVQPMKAIAAVAISQNFSREETTAAGISVAIAVLSLSLTGLLSWLNRVVPVPVVKGIQVGAGLSLVISAGSSLIAPLDWVKPGWDNRVLAVVAFLFLLVAGLVPRLPYALAVFVIGLILAGATADGSTRDHHAGIWHPPIVVPLAKDWGVGAVDAALPQLPLTTLNSILAVTSLSASLFPSNFPPAPSTTHMGLSIAIANLIGCWFGAMPICHGSGGLAGQYRFGARSGASIIILGLVKLILGLFVGEAIVPVLQKFPKSLLGIMVLAAGVELAKVGQSVSESPDLWEQAHSDHHDGGRLPDKTKQANEQLRRDRWMVMLITAAGCLAFKNDAVGFIAGLVWHWGVRVPELIHKVRGRGAHGSTRLHAEIAEEGHLLDQDNS